tara:strand:+ start:323 stop:1606 length:1284 start_codon:yes stop_codon:yes gene_type:complete
MLKREISPTIKALEIIKLKEPNLEFLDNGIEVAFFNLGSQDLIHIELVFETGLSQADNIVVPTAVSELFGTASEQFKSGEIAEKIDFYGAFLETSINMDLASISIYSLTEHIEDVLSIVSDALFNLVYTQKDLDIFLSNASQKLKAEIERVEYVCLRTFNKHLFLNHPYGRTVAFSDFENVSSNELLLHFNNYFNPQHASIIISGNFDKHSIHKSLNNYFGSWKGKSTKQELFTINKSELFKLFIPKKEAVQSAIRIGKIINVKYGSSDYFNLKLLTTILGGYFGSRLMSNLREDKGLTYGINSSLINYDYASFVVISSTVKGESTSLALKEIYYEIKKLSTHLIDNEELELVKNYISGSLMRTIDGPFLIAEQYKLLNHKGRNLEYLEHFYASIMKVTAESLMETAKKYYAVETFSELVVGPESNN